MSWLIVFLSGLAVGWAVELLLDVWFWGRRLRGVQAQLRGCHSDHHVTKKQLAETRAAITKYQTIEGEYQKCRTDLGHLAEKQAQMEALTKKMTHEIDASKYYAEQLTEEIEDLTEERDQLSVHMEDVGKSIESTFRERIWSRDSRQTSPRHIIQSSGDYARSVATAATSTIGRAAGKLGSRATQAKERFGQTFQMARSKRLLHRWRCAVWALIGKVYKKASTPVTCDIGKSH